MATDFGEKERAFIDGLKENTGRDLGEWMQAIAAPSLPQRNDIIDWLRHKGFMFSKASWLERIHHNGGKPIYADAPKEAAPRAPPRRREGVLADRCRPLQRHRARACRRRPPPPPAARRRRATSRRCSPRPRPIARWPSTCSPRSSRVRPERQLRRA